MKKIFSDKLSFFWLAVILVWAKTYASYFLEFNLGVKGALQHFLLFLNPFSTAILILSIGLFAKGRKAAIAVLILDAILTLVLYSNIIFYRFFDDFLTLSNIGQAGNLGNMEDGVFASIKPHDFVYFIDFAILLAVMKWKSSQLKLGQLKKKIPAYIMLGSVALFFFNLAIAEIDRPELLQRTFDRNYIVKYLGPYNYTIYNGIQTVQSESQRVSAKTDDHTEVLNYTRAHSAKPNPAYFGAAQGKNIIKIHLESFQSFLIDYQLNGEEVTPFLNKLAHGQEDIIYFDNFFHQTGQGKTADAELILDNGFFGLPEGSAFVTKADNTYQALPAILNQKQNYTSAVMHGDYKSFWNRDQIYKKFGIDQFFDASSYTMTEDNLVNLGLKDKPFFQESIPMLQSLKQPFYAHLMTLTNHYPFILDPDEATIAKGTTGDKTVDGYFQTARYLDEALEQFFTDLKNAGLYENSVIMIYGDHNGISENHNRAMKEVLGKDIDEYQNAMNQRVPFMLHIPGKNGGVNHTFAGETDVMPTLLHLIGIDSKEFVLFGTDLFSEDHDSTVAFRDGSYVNPEYTFVNNSVYDTNSGEQLELNEETDSLKTKVNNHLALSDSVLYKDLLRFHKTPDFMPVDPSQYQYGMETEDKNQK
ncbi:LTA synthase family protein [Jeotgalibacillus soli]|uniref:Polyglycerolphosphate lipoteichoic acid synthase LtaS n=1 Tax=Jeotgalibacillus soli TaxID=889306 RepID=A0A0C2R4D0_9BACL|nr:LTA synthase family protein [Jeotgalibacillus soli]KIL45090.1 polyglycerolphosphate lipoteichoic acid synthase LtaS [Jeotgalibacillus soli]